MIHALGSGYAVRPLTMSDLDGPYPSWFEDQEVCRFNSHGKFFKTREWFRSYLADLDREDRVVWAMEHEADGHVGNVSLQDISFINRTAEFAILIGDRRHWGKGLGRLAGRVLLEHGFQKLGLARVFCATAATNAGMSRLARDLGMTLEGTRRSHLWLEGGRVDVLEYGILRDEFVPDAP